MLRLPDRAEIVVHCRVYEVETRSFYHQTGTGKGRLLSLLATELVRRRA